PARDDRRAPKIELEPGLVAGARDFAQASAAGNAALIALARAALGPGPGKLVELYAGGGNLTRGFVADGWDVHASDTAPAGTLPRRGGPRRAAELAGARRGAA